MKKLLFSTLVISMFATSVQADSIPQPYGKLKKQIDIMSNIITTSLAGNDKKSRNSVSVEGFYLKSQGVVFEISSGRGFNRILQTFGHDARYSFSFEGDDGDVPIPPVPPVAPVGSVVIGDSDLGDFINITVDQSMEVYEEAMETFRENADHARELRNEQRDLSYEVRNLARRKRDLEFEMRHADAETMAELKKDLAELEGEMGKLEKKSSELAKRAEKEEAVINARKAERAERLKAAQQTYFKQLDTSISETLCNYGAGLRDLEKNEYVTFVIDMGDGNNSGKSKKIHKFSKQDVLSCVVESKTAAQLLKTAQSYYY